MQLLRDVALRLDVASEFEVFQQWCSSVQKDPCQHFEHYCNSGRISADMEGWCLKVMLTSPATVPDDDDGA